MGGRHQPRLPARRRHLASDIRAPEISDGASRVSALPEVRAALLDLQRRLGAAGGVVVEGRDIGTVVFPHAAAKFFLTATADERARRRVIELRAAGRTVDPAETLAELRERDHRDSTRAVAPLRKADDAVEIDSSGMGPGRRPRSDGRSGAISRRLTPRDRGASISAWTLPGSRAGAPRTSGIPRRSLTFPNVDASFRAFAAPNGRGARKITPNPELGAARGARPIRAED